MLTSRLLSFEDTFGNDPVGSKGLDTVGDSRSGDLTRLSPPGDLTPLSQRSFLARMIFVGEPGDVFAWFSLSRPAMSWCQAKMFGPALHVPHPPFFGSVSASGANII